jgi:prepilin-type N-terminal cleavage/methylation domain-containing protein
MPQLIKRQNVMTRSRFTNQYGFTLLEVVIALLIFTIGLLAVAHMQVVSRYCINKAKKGLINDIAAANELERLLALAYEAPQLADLDDGYHPEKADHGPFDIAQTRSTIEWEVDDDYPAAHTKRITVTVRSVHRSGRPQIFSYDYIKSKDYI